MRTLYVAYGSNMNIKQMAMRCPTARIYSTGILNNWELIYRGSRTGAYASIKRMKGSIVPVLVWTISEQDEKNLDRYEGYPNFYHKQNVMVDLPFGKRKCMVYIMNSVAKPGRPSERYIKTIHDGYVSNCLNLEYFYESLRKNEIECNKKKTLSFTETSLL